MTTFKNSSGESENRFISFYGEHGISPVRQDISDFSKHVARREKLYRSLGVPPILMKGKTILEVGPGGGYNSLALFHWGASVDFVEPNKIAQDELCTLVNKHSISSSRWNLFRGRIEDYSPENTYDLILAEGFLPGLTTRDAVITRLSQLLAPGGVIVVTCIDDLSFLMEFVRRLVGARLVWLRKAQSFAEKLTILCEAFAPHLAELKYASRPVEDWVADSFLNSTIYAEWFSIEECIKEFGPSFSLLGASPQMFTNYSWYKDLEYDSRANVLSQFQEKRHMLLLVDMEETIRGSEANHLLWSKAHALRRTAASLEQDMNNLNSQVLADSILDISSLCTSIDSRIVAALTETAKLIRDPELTVEKIGAARSFAQASGRTQQYLSLVKSTE